MVPTCERLCPIVQHLLALKNTNLKRKNLRIINSYLQSIRTSVTDSQQPEKLKNNIIKLEVLTKFPATRINSSVSDINEQLDSFITVLNDEHLRKVPLSLARMVSGLLAAFMDVLNSDLAKEMNEISTAVLNAAVSCGNNFSLDQQKEHLINELLNVLYDDAAKNLGSDGSKHMLKSVSHSSKLQPLLSQWENAYDFEGSEILAYLQYKYDSNGVEAYGVELMQYAAQNDKNDWSLEDFIHKTPTINNAVFTEDEIKKYQKLFQAYCQAKKSDVNTNKVSLISQGVTNLRKNGNLDSCAEYISTTFSC